MESREDVQSAGEKVTKGARPLDTLHPLPRPAYSEVADTDPNLALVGLRIELEKRLRELARQHKLPDSRSLTRLSEELAQRGVQDLMHAGNRAAHGAEVDDRVTMWAIEHGPRVLAALESKLKESHA